jgi:hypothetical protein
VAAEVERGRNCEADNHRSKDQSLHIQLLSYGLAACAAVSVARLKSGHAANPGKHPHSAPFGSES